MTGNTFFLIRDEVPEVLYMFGHFALSFLVDSKKEYYGELKLPKVLIISLQHSGAKLQQILGR